MMILALKLAILTRLSFASIIESTDRNLGPPSDRNFFPSDGVHDYEENNNNQNEQFNSANLQGSRNSGYSRNFPPPPPPPPPPPRTAWKWWRYHTLSDKEILDQLLHHQRYDRREKPPFDGTLQINMSVNILSVILKEKSKHKVDLVLYQEWFDARLIHESRPGGASIFLNGILHFREIWMPDIYFIRKDSVEENPIHPAQIALHIYANGTVHYILRRHLDLECSGDRKLYPFDIFKCSLQLQSASHPRNELDLIWSTGTTSRKEDTKIRNLHSMACNNQQTWRGNYSCLQINLNIPRDQRGIWSRVYWPDLLTTVMITISFSLRSSALPRILVVFTSLMFKLAFSTIGLGQCENDLSSDNDNNSEWSPMDIWKNATLAFIYAAFVELILVNAFSSKISLAPRDSCHHSQLSQNSHTCQNSCSHDDSHKFVRNTHSSNTISCAAINQAKCDCGGHYSSIGGSHPNVSLLMDGADVCVRCNTGIRSIDLSETPIDERINFQNPFERRDNFHQLTNPTTQKGITRRRRNIWLILDRIFGIIFGATYLAFVATYFCKFLD